jgi:hypothetical protein
MLKDIDDKPKETAKAKAERMWRNHNIEMRLKEEIKTAKAEPKKPKELQISQTITNKKPDRRYRTTRAQTKFAKYIREMMNEQSERNLTNYKVALRVHKIKLLKAKAKLLKLMKLKELEDEATKQQEAQQVQNPPVQKPVKKDLFS